MKQQEMQRILREISGVRVGSHTAQYVVAQLQSSQSPPHVLVMGGDARTGRPVHRSIETDTLLQNTETLQADRI